MIVREGREAEKMTAFYIVVVVVVVFSTWNSSCSFFSIHSVTWQKVTSLSPSLGRTCRSNLGGTEKLYLQRRSPHHRIHHIDITFVWFLTNKYSFGRRWRISVSHTTKTHIKSQTKHAAAERCSLSIASRDAVHFIHAVIGCTVLRPYKNHFKVLIFPVCTTLNFHSNIRGKYWTFCSITFIS